ncbi:ankyrin repeat domain-containing protein [Streptomyces sp. ME19-01-6]|uniref:ankyrin repeat domain-containing protein n=1 Tax=Streptomyces sp. ME19-01-6 TaxID=3028686 RepID=UPI0029BA39B5|nr:ankyrin repeat domain-containing protein [Streptomyces sp. ME19-01-6]MDX3227576.1 ankyrin repeat domain-containing protein [Streptomyces sp. ME19-01-6]
MDLNDVLRCLKEAEADHHRPELRGKRYVPVVNRYAYDDATPLPLDLFDGIDDEEGEECSILAGLGEATSVYDALDILASAVSDEVGDPPDEQDMKEADLQRLDGIHSPEHRALACLLMGYEGAIEVDTSEGPGWLAGARMVFLSTAVPPNQEADYGILELQPTGEPSDADRALMDAAEDGDTDALSEALSEGAHVNALDERGMSALHIAVAHRRLSAVTALLAAGADPALQFAYNNAPQFASLDDSERVSAGAERLEDDEHLAILHALIEAGAPVNAQNRDGSTLLDMAIATQPYPEETIRFLVGKGTRSVRLTDPDFGRLLAVLPYSDGRQALETRVNEVRFLLESGARPEDAEVAAQQTWLRHGDGPALHALLAFTGYYEREVPGDILVELVDVLLRHGVRDTSYQGSTALERAEEQVKNGHANYEPVVRRLREAAAQGGA